MREHAKAVHRNRNKSAVMRLNSYIIGVHNYYNCATNCSSDFSAIAYRTRSILKNRLKPRKPKEKEPIPKYIKDMYGKSKQLRFVYDTPLIPIGYVQHRWNGQYDGKSTFITTDREQIHTEQKVVPIENLKYLVANPVKGQSAEYNDNRISLYVGQYGKCYVLGNTLDVDEIHCHHKKPRALNGKDEYKNLVIVHENVHRLIHATDNETINRYTNLLELNAEQLEKVNKLRVLAGNQLIA
ncbi:MAG: HNH endonuclease [Spirochaetia bacterium]|nr:HNH endonuclease [Spirochaetia bacterium]